MKNLKFKEVYYSVQNGGDGSAYPSFFESQELAEWDQEHMDEGWGEPCTGSLTFAEETTIEDNVTTKEEYLANLIDSYDPDPAETASFKIAFFPDGAPHYTVGKRPNYNDTDKFRGYAVYHNGAIVHESIIRKDGMSNEELEEKFNAS